MKGMLPAVSTLVLWLLSAPALAWDAGRTNSPVNVNGQVIGYRIFAVFVMPNSRIDAAFVDATGGASLQFNGKKIALGSPLQAPETPGLSVLVLTNEQTGESVRINVFTMVPADKIDKNGLLKGYRIGRYPTAPLRGLDIYMPPKGFVEVTKANADVQVSPHFRLGQFVSKQKSGYPRYLVLRTPLLLKLENILGALNRAGHDIPGFVIMSGYRTPFYNRAIGNVQYSRHVWGGAADIYIDVDPVDGRMDDMNQDGKVDRQDARWLADFINRMSQAGAFGKRIGGLGVYGSTSAHGPFVHTDVRGSRAYW